MTITDRLKRACEFDNDKAENRAAYHHLDFPEMHVSQSHYEGERAVYTRLQPLLQAMIEAVEALVEIRPQDGETGLTFKLSTLERADHTLANIQRALDEMEGK